jgi:hypothetical protein
MIGQLPPHPNGANLPERYMDALAKAGSPLCVIATGRRRYISKHIRIWYVDPFKMTADLLKVQVF